MGSHKFVHWIRRGIAAILVLFAIAFVAVYFLGNTKTQPAISEKASEQAPSEQMPPAAPPTSGN